jgi:hypothetical protein
METVMKKIAIFVEGQTEQIFVLELIKTIFSEKSIAIEINQFSGKIGLRKIINIRTADIDDNTAFYFRIFDCHGGGDISTVKSDILEQLNELEAQTFYQIIGIRDVYPLPDPVKLRRNLNNDLHGKIPISIVLAVQEIEAWFLAEENHYQQISSKLSIDTVNSIAGIDVSKDSTESISQPSETLKRIYNSVNIGYQKTKKQVQRTVSALDFINLYINVKKRNKSFNEFVSCLDGILCVDNFQAKEK